MELGLQPRPLRQSLTDAIAWFRAEGLLVERGDGRGEAVEVSAGE